MRNWNTGTRLGGWTASVAACLLAAACESDAGSPAERLDDNAADVSPPVRVEETRLQLARDKPFPAERGWLRVPENRSIPESATIEVGFYRLRSTAKEPAAPVFVLPGGPGSSWITELEQAAREQGKAAERKRLFFQQHFFEDLRSVADVVIVDQRGAGISRPKLTCDDRSRIASGVPITTASYTDAARRFVGDCLEQLEASGRDARGYTVFELVEDVNALRKALGYERITLFAGSFGSQWSLSFIKQHEPVVVRFVFWGLEGLDHAYDDPGGILDALSAIYEDASPPADEADFRDLLQASLGRLRASPVSVQVSAAGEDDVPELHFGPAELQRSLFGADDFTVRDRLSIPSWQSYVSELFAGEYTRAAGIVHRFKQVNDPGDPVPQYLSIDCGLSVSEERRVGLELDPAARLLGNINLTYDVVCRQWPTLDVGDEFRRPKVSDLPGLLIHGTWDVSTPFGNAVDVAVLFPEAELIPVRRATHRVLRELYRERGPKVRPLLRAFLAGESVRAPSMIELPRIRSRPTTSD